MWLRAEAFLLTLLLGVAGCGYHFAGQTPVVFPGGIASLSIGEVVNPSVETWIGPRLRNTLWNELTRRSDISLTEPGRAEAVLELRIRRYSSAALLKGHLEQTIKSQVAITFEGRLVRNVDDRLLWESGPMTVTESFVTQAEERAAAERAVDRAARRLADRLDQSF
jgi:outer membrane lipopolysaccharide assembly protein LptE/RlpB